MPAILDAKKLVGRILKGDVVAGVELARKCQVGSISELVRRVCPKDDPSPVVFDTCADAWALYQRRDLL